MNRRPEAEPGAERFADVARSIAGKDSPELAANLYECAKLVRAHHDSEKSARTRTETRDWLREIEASLELVMAALENPLRSFLDQEGPQGIDTLDALAVLGDLRERARLAADKIRGGGGPDLAYPHGVSVTARDLAALVVLIAWRHMERESESPGPTMRRRRK
jgi:hypothetical protein